MAKVRLSVKLLGSFGAVALIVLVLGLVGYYASSQGADAVRELGEVIVPKVENLLILRAEAERIRGTMRSLAIPGLPREVRERQYRHIAESRERYEQAWKAYEGLSKSPEEAQLWKDFVPAWEAWREANNQALEQARKVDALGISDPYVLLGKLEEFQKGHYRLITQV